MLVLPASVCNQASARCDKWAQPVPACSVKNVICKTGELVDIGAGCDNTSRRHYCNQQHN